MAIRPIDGDELLGITRLLDTDAVRQSKTASWLLDQVLHDIQAMPTLTPPNEPLTIEQLREMDGEPVWVKCLKPDKYTCPPIEWRILETAITGTFGVWGDNSVLIERDYGTDWLAYRRPPEGEA